jgi:transposase-like protein
MKQKASVKQSRQRYSDEFKEQALRRAGQEGIATVAKDLKLPARVISHQVLRCANMPDAED